MRRTDRIPSSETGGISVVATEPSLADTVGASLRSGRFLDAATARLPTVVLGSVAARRLGIGSVGDGVAVWIGDQWFTVIGIVEPVPLAANLDSAALVGYDIAADRFATKRNPATVYVTTEKAAVDAVRKVLAATAKPAAPNEVTVSRPSDALAARAATDTAFRSLLLGLGAVSLLVGAIGIANVMVVAVLERRSEIVVRRALGATKGEIRGQFLTEAVALGALGGAIGGGLGVGVTAGFSAVRNVSFAVPPQALGGGVLVALLLGGVAGLWPAVRAARVTPVDALRPG